MSLFAIVLLFLLPFTEQSETSSAAADDEKPSVPADQFKRFEVVFESGGLL